MANQRQLERLVKQGQCLPQRDEYWIATSRLARMWITPKHASPYRPYLTLLLSQHGKIVTSHVLEHPPTADALFAELLRAMRRPALGAGRARRPTRIYLDNAEDVAGFFELRDLGEVPVKGRAPVHAFEVLRPRSRQTRFAVAVERGLTPLVGRERELATLRERFRAVKAGRGQVAGIAAEAGMGKSRLVLELRRALAQAGEAVTWLEGHCISFGQASPFLPLIEQLRENFHIDEFDGAPEIIAKVEQGMRRMGEVEAHIPAIRSLLSVDPGDAAFAAMDGPTLRRQLFAALRALSLRGAQRRPLVLVIEDLHWIDTSSEEFLAFLLDAVAGMPLLLLVTYRIGYTTPFGSRSFYTTLTLHSFSEAEMLAMVGHVLGTEQFPTELQTALMAKAEGVPLFIEEVTKTLLDLGVLQREPSGYRLVKNLSEVS